MELRQQIEAAMRNPVSAGYHEALGDVLRALDGDPAPLAQGGRLHVAGEGLRPDPDDEPHEHNLEHRVVHECSDCGFMDDG